MSNLIACRVASYGKFEDRAWTHLPEIGIHNIEAQVPAPDELAQLKKKLADHGLTASSLQGSCDVQKPDAAEVMKPQLEACAELGAKICFLSAKAGEADRSAVYDRLRTIGDDAAGRGVTVAVETHPDLAENGTVARETMEAVNHANVRINFDTANIYFYNDGLKADTELPKVIDYVAAIHLKDTTGGFKTWNFPALRISAGFRLRPSAANSSSENRSKLLALEWP